MVGRSLWERDDDVIGLLLSDLKKGFNREISLL